MASALSPSRPSAGPCSSRQSAISSRTAIPRSRSSSTSSAISSIIRWRLRPRRANSTTALGGRRTKTNDGLRRSAKPSRLAVESKPFPSRSEFRAIAFHRFGLSASDAFDFAVDRLKRTLTVSAHANSDWISVSLPATSDTRSDRPPEVIPYTITFNKSSTSAITATSHGRNRMRIVVRETMTRPGGAGIHGGRLYRSQDQGPVVRVGQRPPHPERRVPSSSP